MSKDFLEYDKYCGRKINRGGVLTLSLQFCTLVFMNTTLQIRLDAKTKSSAQKIFQSLGVDMSSGVKMFLQQVVNTESIPFEIRTKNGFTLKKEKQILKETAQTLKQGKGYRTAEEMHRDILR
jgi:DNA-damage-inducible protein J